MNKDKILESAERNMQKSKTTQLLTAKEVCSMLSVCRATITRWISEGRMPTPIKMGRSIRWNLSTIEEWIEQSEKKGRKKDS